MVAVTIHTRLLRTPAEVARPPVARPAAGWTEHPALASPFRERGASLYDGQGCSRDTTLLLARRCRSESASCAAANAIGTLAHPR